MKWLLIWIIGGQVSGASLPERQVFSTQTACEAAAKTINQLGGVKLAGPSMTVQAACIEIESSDE